MLPNMGWLLLNAADVYQTINLDWIKLLSFIDFLASNVEVPVLLPVVQEKEKAPPLRCLIVVLLLL